MLKICNVKLTAREREIVALLRSDPTLDATALAERIGSTRAAVSVHLSNLMKKGVVRGRGYLLRAEADSVVVVGGAVLDTKVRTSGAPVLRTSNPGTASWTAGGVGRNIAENLARLGSPTLLVAAVGDDPAAETVLARTTAAGVECRHVVTSVHPTGTYAAVLDDGGDLLVAVADMRATDELTVSDLAVVPSLLGGADALVVDANLDADVVRWLLVRRRGRRCRRRARAGERRQGHRDRAGLRRLGARAHGDPERRRAGRPRRATRARHRRRRGAGRPRPARPWRRARLGPARHARQPAVDRVLAQRHRRPGDAPPPGGDTASGPRVVLVGAPPVDVADVTGAGDAMTAGYVHALLAGDDVVEAARYGQVLAALTCASADTVRPDLTAALVAAHLTPTQPPTEELDR